MTLQIKPCRSLLGMWLQIIKRQTLMIGHTSSSTSRKSSQQNSVINERNIKSSIDNCYHHEGPAGGNNFGGPSQ
jgi:hypothetical protein